MGKTDPGDALIKAPDQALSRNERADRLNQLSLSYAARAQDEADLASQAQQMHIAIEASRQQLEESLLALREEALDFKEETTGKVEEVVETVRQKLDVKAMIRKHPWPAVGIAFAVGFYLAMD